MVIQMIHVISKCLLSSDSRRNVLELLLDHLLWLTVYKVIKPETERVSSCVLERLIMRCILHMVWIYSILLNQSLMFFLHHIYVFTSTKIMVFL